ncbi:MAG: DUF3127 domain-containing protein [Bacteroidales bacterium]|nr:DUF3127 domain-containing protein [Bacteroidales bacterium]
MEVTGKIIQLLDLLTGESKNGEWKKQDFIVETGSQYPKKVCISVWGDKIDQFNLKEGEDVTVSINLESREFNNRWYTDVRAWKVEKKADAPEDSDSFLPDEVQGFGEPEPDDLPF